MGENGQYAPKNNKSCIDLAKKLTEQQKDCQYNEITGVLKSKTAMEIQQKQQNL